MITMYDTLKTLGAAMESLVNRQGEFRQGHEGPPAKRAHKEGVHETDQSDDDLMDYIQPKAQTAEDAESDEDFVLLNGIEKDLNSDKSCGPDIKDKLANIINKRFSSVLQPEKIKEKQEKYDRPNNCTKLIVPECNKVIKEMLRPGIIARDRQFQYIQLAITKVLVPSVCWPIHFWAKIHHWV